MYVVDDALQSETCMMTFYRKTHEDPSLVTRHKKDQKIIAAREVTVLQRTQSGLRRTGVGTGDGGPQASKLQVWHRRAVSAALGEQLFYCYSTFTAIKSAWAYGDVTRRQQSQPAVCLVTGENGVVLEDNMGEH